MDLRIAEIAGTHLIYRSGSQDPLGLIAINIDGSVSGIAGGAHISFDNDGIVLKYTPNQEPLARLTRAATGELKSSGDSSSITLRPLGHVVGSHQNIGAIQPLAKIAAHARSRQDGTFEIAPAATVGHLAKPIAPEDPALLGPRWDDFHSSSYSAAPATVHLVHGATLINGVTVMTSQGAALEDTTYQAELRSRRSEKSSCENRDQFYPVKNLTYKRHHDGTSFLFNTLFDNYGHWHMQSVASLAALYKLQGSLEGEIKNIVVTNGFRFEDFRRQTIPSRLLDGFNVIDPAFPTIDEAAFFERLLVPSFHRIQHLERFHPVQVHLLRDEHQSDSLSTGDKLLYVSRQDVGGRRVIKNETDMIEALERRGFDIIVPGRLSLEQQRAAFKRAKLIVGAHGGGLMNMIHSPPGTKVLEIFHDLQVNSWYRNVASISGFDYHYTICRVADGDRHLGWHANFEIDVARCVNFIDGML